MSETPIYWGYPTHILLASGCSQSLGQWCAKAGAHSPLVVTDPGVRQLPWFAPIWERLRQNCPAAGLFSDIQANPTFENSLAGAEAFRQGRHDLVVAIGGGSAIDAAKGIALAVGGDSRLQEFEWSRALAAYPTLADYPRLGLPSLIILPTTAGTGSELSREAVLVNSQEQIKQVVTHAELLAYAVLLDPLLTVGLPPSLTAATGMDALVHHIEALCSPLPHPMSEGIALEGIRLVAQHLPTAVRNGQDIAARAGMLTASAMAAVAFQKGLGGVHALAHPLGAKYGHHHGLLNAILLPYVLRANRSAIAEPMERLARMLALPGHSPQAVEDWVLDLRRQLGIPHNLESLGLDGSDAEWVGAKALADISSSDTNPRPLTAADYAEIYRAAVIGRLN